jgi:hypothetical protein
MFNIKFDVEDFFLTIKEDQDEEIEIRRDSLASDFTIKERRKIIREAKNKARKSFNKVYVVIYSFTVGFYTTVYYYTGQMMVFLVPVYRIFS